MSYTEFTCRSGGSNLYAGSLDGSAEASTTPLVTYTNGGWNSGTGVFTPTSGNPSATGVAVGNWVSIYLDGAATPTGFVGRVTAVSTTTITVSITAKSGTVPTTAGTGLTLVVGGAWVGPSGTVAFPFNFAQSTMTDASSNPPRINLKNDQTYASTAAWSRSTDGPITFQGYTTTFGDGGRWTQTVAVGASYIAFAQTGNNVKVADCIINASAFTSGSSTNFSTGGGASLYERCVTFGGRANGFATNLSTIHLIECEVYSYGAAANAFGFDLNNGGIATRCIAHDPSGATCGGFRGSTGAFIDCISDTVTGVGFTFGGSNAGTMRGCSVYNSSSHGVSITGAGLVPIENCIFVANGGYGVNAGSTVPPRIVNCGYYLNTSGQTNGSVDTSGAITLSGDPFVDAPNGDFRLNATSGAGAACRGTGRGIFTQTAASYAGSIGYPDVGAVQHQDSGGSAGMLFIPNMDGI